MIRACYVRTTYTAVPGRALLVELWTIRVVYVSYVHVKK